MSKERYVEHPFVIRYYPPNLPNKVLYFSVSEMGFTEVRANVTRFKSVEVAIAFAHEFGVKLDNHTDVHSLIET